MRLRTERGFTLAELLVVVLILGIIGMLVIPKFAQQPEKARLAVVQADLKTIKSALEVYQIENPADGFPAPDRVGAVLRECGIKWTTDDAGIRDPWGKPYRYTVNDDRTEFTVTSTGRKEGSNWYVTAQDDPREGGPAGPKGAGSQSCAGD